MLWSMYKGQQYPESRNVTDIAASIIITMQTIDNIQSVCTRGCSFGASGRASKRDFVFENYLILLHLGKDEHTL